MLRVIGAGLPRTATTTLKAALTRLTGEPTYHMTEVFRRPEHVQVWQGALDGEPTDWHALLDGYAAAVDWPASAFWPELADAFPDAPVLLSTRTDGATWWRSADATIMDSLRDPAVAVSAEWRAMAVGLWRRTLLPGWDDPQANAEAYDAWVASVRGRVPADRLVDWTPADGWEPLCAALGAPVPDDPLPHLNSTADFHGRRED